jgi:predicted dehydrogenase
MSYRVLIVGSGNVGSRHIQGILKSKFRIDIHVVEKNINSIFVTKKRISEVKYLKKKIFFYKNLNFKKKKFDLAIVATNSTGRLNLIKKTLKFQNIKNMIIEKVAFQSVKDHLKAIKIIEKNKTSAWVNCARNYNPIYSLIKKKINNKKSIKVHVKGNGWNLASNSIHFVELFNFLSSREISQNFFFDKTNKVLDSKRKGFKEIKGTFKISNRFGDSLILKDNYKYKKNSLNVKIYNSGNIIYIDEHNRIIKSKMFGQKIFYFKELKQSNLSKKYIDSIIMEKKILLPSLENSYMPHKLLIELIMDNLKFKNYKFKKCPIS